MGVQDTREMIDRVLRKLGFVFTYDGTGYLADAVLLCILEPEALTAVTKRVYPAVAKQAGIARWKNVERNIRTAMEGFWQRGNREMLDKIVGFPLQTRPSVGDMISYIVGYIREEELCMRYVLPRGPVKPLPPEN